VPDSSYRTNKLIAHRLGVNAFFCALAEASRAFRGQCLATWRPEHWVRTRTAEVKPDGFGRYLHPGGACEFYFEYDRATEARGALTRKLEGYLKLAAGWTREQELTGFPNVLVLVPEEGREGEVATAFRSSTTSLHASGSLASLFPLYVASENRLNDLGVFRDCLEARTDRRRAPRAHRTPGPIPRPVPIRTMPRPVLHRRRSRTSASHLPRIGHTPVPRPAAPTCPLRPRREDAPTDAGLRRRRGRGDDVTDVERRREGLDAVTEAEAAEVGATLGPLARALLALAEQLMGEEAP